MTMSFFKELFEILASIPVFGIIRTVFSGEMGWKTPVAFVLQIALQITCVVMLGMGFFGGALAALALIVLHLLTGLMIGMMPFSEMGPDSGRLYKSPAGFLLQAAFTSLLFTGIGGAVIIGLSMFCATGWGFFSTMALSVLGGTAIHMFGAALPVYQVMTKPKDEQNNA